MNNKLLLFTALFIVFLSCTQKEAKTTDSVSDANLKDKELAEEGITAKDTAFVKSIIQKLKGIEKFAVKEDFELLSSLLEYKGDSINHAKLKSILEKNGKGYYNTYFIEALDIRNGYIRYMPHGAEGVYTLTYWNLDDGAKLIANEAWGCGPVCDSHLSFEKFQNGTYEKLENQTIIPEIKDLPKKLLPDYKPENEPEDEPYEFKYKLPQGGKNIQFCQGNYCIELEWQNGTFKLNEQ